MSSGTELTEPQVATADRFADVDDPANGHVNTRILLASAGDVDVAVAAAASAFQQWRRTSLSTRVAVLFAFRERVLGRQEQLAAIITAENGKTLEDARGEVRRGLDAIEFACGVPHLVKGEYSSQVSRGIDSYEIREPVGVAAVITPFNFPFMVAMWFCPLAVATGNAVIWKPSEKVPTAADVVAELWLEAGLPQNVFNVVHGDGVAANALLQHAEVRMVSFVGSTPVARHVYAEAARTGKRVQALGGAKNHVIVLPGADLESVAEGVVGAAFGSAGQRCMAVSVVVAVEPIADKLVALIAERIEKLVVGDGRDGADMGPVISGASRDRLVRYVHAGLADGATAVVDGTKHEAVERDGHWIGPTLLDNVTPKMSVYRDEVFGPLLSVCRVPSYEEGIALINDNPYGNGAAIYTESGSLARDFQSRVSAGMVGINVPIPVPMAYHSFGGWKDSFFGTARAQGTDGVEFFTRAKVVTERWSAAQPAGLAFPVSS